MNEREKPSLVKKVFDKIVRVETEPSESVLRRHLQKIEQLREQRRNLLEDIHSAYPTDKAKLPSLFDSLRDVGNRYTEQRAGYEKPRRTLVLFNSQKMVLG